MKALSMLSTFINGKWDKYVSILITVSTKLKVIIMPSGGEC